MPHLDPEKRRAYCREWQRQKAKQRKDELNQLLGGKCWMCALTTRLRVDHINFRLICEPCLYDARRKAKHGTVSMYRHCKCLKCKDAKAAYMREYQKQYRKAGRDKSRKNYRAPSSSG